MSAIIQMPTPVAELADRPRPAARLAYTRKDGWLVVIARRPADDHTRETWFARPGGKRINEYEILAWADLPPVPETAA